MSNKDKKNVQYVAQKVVENTDNVETAVVNDSEAMQNEIHEDKVEKQSDVNDVKIPEIIDEPTIKEPVKPEIKESVKPEIKTETVKKDVVKDTNSNPPVHHYVKEEIKSETVKESIDNMIFKYAIQIKIGNVNNTEKTATILNRLGKAGIKDKIVNIKNESDNIHACIYVGPFDSYDEVVAAKKLIVKNGLKGHIVENHMI